MIVGGAALLSALAAWLLVPAPSTLGPPVAVAPAAEVDAGLLRRFRPLLALLAGLGAWLFVGTSLGPVVGLAVAVGAWIVLGRTESPAVRRRREAITRDLPLAVALLAACLDAGRDVDSSLVVVAEGVRGPVGEELRGVHHRLALGADPASVWATVAEDPRLAGLARSVMRSQASGASVAGAVRRLADDLSAAGRADLEAVAHRVGVRAALPLGLCFLPAFLLLGVVPMAVGLITALHLFD